MWFSRLRDRSRAKTLRNSCLQFRLHAKLTNMENEASSDKDTTEAYDAKHGDPAKSCDHESVNLSESANKAPPQYTPFKITTSK